MSIAMDPLLQDLTPTATISLLLTFAEFVRRGRAGRGLHVGHQTVKVVLCAIRATSKMDDKPNLCHKYGTNPCYWKHLKLLIEAYCQEDPTPQAKLAVLVTIPH